MITKTGIFCWLSRKNKGLTLIEILVVIGIMGIMMAIATPPFLQWRSNLVYRQTAREMTLLLREARNRAISRNLQYMVVFQPNNSLYRMDIGNRANNSSVYTPIAGQTTTTPPNVIIRSGPLGTTMTDVFVQFNPNGTAILRDPAVAGLANDGNISVNDRDTAAQRYLVTVMATGRISMVKQ
jgi:prepilin-type N-terminal cleavage/methylation domain-containing protein